MTTELRPPWRVEGTSVKPIALSGSVMPWEVQGPVFLSMPGSEARYLPCFSEPDALHEMMRRLNIVGYTVKQVTDGVEFIESLPSVWAGRALHVIYDPRFTEEGTVRFTQVIGAS